MFSGWDRCAGKLIRLSFGWLVDWHWLGVSPGAAQRQEWKDARVSPLRARREFPDILTRLALLNRGGDGSSPHETADLQDEGTSRPHPDSGAGRRHWRAGHRSGGRTWDRPDEHPLTEAEVSSAAANLCPFAPICGPRAVSGIITYQYWSCAESGPLVLRWSFVGPSIVLRWSFVASPEFLPGGSRVRRLPRR